MRAASQQFRTATNPSPTCKLPECDQSVYIPPPLHSNSSQVHVKGQVYIKIVLKPLGKVGVKEKKVVDSTSSLCYGSLKGAQSTAQGLDLPSPRSSEASELEVHRCSLHCSLKWLRRVLHIHSCSKWFCPAVSRCQLCPFLTLLLGFTVAFSSL